MVVPFLGYFLDSSRQAFIPPCEKNAKFRALRESILAKKTSKKTISLTQLQKFAGKTVFYLGCSGGTTLLACHLPCNFKSARYPPRICFRNYYTGASLTAGQVFYHGGLNNITVFESFSTPLTSGWEEFFTFPATFSLTFMACGGMMNALPPLPHGRLWPLLKPSISPLSVFL